MLIIALISKWLALAIILIFLGGIIVMFFYATSLSNNDKVQYSINKKIVTRAIFLVLGLGVLEETSFILALSNFVSNLYSARAQLIVFVIMVYLLLSLFIIVKLTFGFEGSLNKRF